MIDIKTTVLISGKDQLYPALSGDKVDTVIVDSTAFLTHDEVKTELGNDLDIIRASGKKAGFALPYVLRSASSGAYEGMWSEMIEAQPDILLARNYDSLGFLEHMGFPKDRVRLDSMLYTFSDQAVETFTKMGYSHFTVPLELNKKELSHRSLRTSEMIVYGRSVLMITANCVHKTLDGCDKQYVKKDLSDRYRKNFQIINVCSDCYNLVLNPDILDITDEQEINMIAPESIRYHFTTEDAARVSEVLRKSPSGGKNDTYTRGHFNRGVE